MTSIAILKHIPGFWSAIMRYVYDSTIESVTALRKLCVEAEGYMSLFAFEPSFHPLSDYRLLGGLLSLLLLLLRLS